MTDIAHQNPCRVWPSGTWPPSIIFEERLDAVGFDLDGRLLGQAVGGRRRKPSMTCVKEFPRITPAMVPGGVGNVRYVISLPDCEEFRVVPASLPITVSGATDDT